MLIDTHTHLDAAEFDADRIEVIETACAAGVDAMIVLGIDASNWDAVRELAHLRPQIYYALGIHPLFVDGSRDSDLDELRARVDRAMADPRFVAIGEIGLDHFVPGVDRERQLQFYEAQLGIAKEFGLPVLLHIRKAQDAILKQLRRYRVAGGIAHAFNGSLQQAHQFIDLGFALGFGGAMTYPRARQIRRLAAEVPLSAVVLETDAPDIPPAWLAEGGRPGRNSPTELPRIAAVLGGLRDEIPFDTLMAAVRANSLRVMPRLQVDLTT